MGKFEKKNRKKQSVQKKRRKSSVGLWIAIAIVAVLLCGIAAMLLLKNDEIPSMQDNDVSLPEPGQIQVQPQVTAATEDEEAQIQIDLGQDLYITGIGKYAGIYMEDGTDEVVSNVLMIRLTNSGEKVLEYAEITLPTSSGDAHFSVSTLNPGATVVLLEKNRMEYKEEAYTGAEADFAAFFDEPLSLCEDVLKIQQLNGAMNITNISENDITGNIRIYYKNSADGIFYGGITYRITLEGGIKAGELRQIMANHFYQDGSTILSVVCEAE